MATVTRARIALPRNWRSSIKSAVLHVVSLARYAVLSTQGAAACSSNIRTRWAAGNGRLKQDNIRPRYGAVGQYGSLAVIERFILSLKTECTRRLVAVPFRYAAFRHELQLYFDWYNGSRPHMSLGGRAPNEVYYAKRPANRNPRFEPRPHWPRASPCAVPRVLVKGQPGVRLELQVRFVAGRQHLPIVTLERAA